MEETEIQPETSKSTRPLTFRIRNIHQGFNRETLGTAIATLFSLTTPEFIIHSLAFDAAPPANHRAKVATITFQNTPNDLKISKEQWNFTIQHRIGGTDQLNVIHIDTTFESFTPLTPAENEEATVADCVLIHGWGGHPIGAFASPDGRYLWPRDDLPTRHPELRIWLYGYYSSLSDPNTIASIDDYADTFRRALQQARGSAKAQQPVRPILYIVHSLGGWVFQHAMIDMTKSDDPYDAYNLKSTIGALYFGVPGQGMRVEEMAAMVQNLPARYTMNLLDRDLGFRQRAKFEDDFRWAWENNDMTIFLFYEEEKTKTMRMDKETQKWIRDGPLALLVEPTSATYGRFPIENKISLRKNHINMVKFSHGDKQYDRVIRPLGKLVEKALEVNAQNPLQTESAVAHTPFKQLTQEEQACLQSLAFPEIHYRKNTIREPAGGTCVWLASHKIYNEWLNAKQGLLWISGKPGSGKSTLMAHIYALDPADNHLDAITISFFFHARGTELQRSLLGFYRSILHQLLTHFHVGLQQLSSVYTERISTIGKHWIWEHKDLEVTFKRSVVEAAQTRPIRIYVDALDEAGEQNAKELIDLFKFLNKQAVSRNGRLAICFSCRHYPLLPIHDVPEICIERENQGDIDTYIKDNIIQRQRSRRSKTELDLIRAAMLDKAEGSFQWVKIILDQVLEMHDHRESFDTLLRAIKDSPEELDNLYRTLINQIDERHRPQALRLFKCVLFAKRPLSTEELRIALTLEKRHTSIKECRDSDLYQSISTGKRLKQRIRFLSAGLIEMPLRMSDQENYENLPERIRRIPYPVEYPQLIHQSAYDFLLTEGLKSLEPETAPDLSESPHVLLATLCLYRLCLEIGNRVPGLGAYSVMQVNNNDILEEYFEREHGVSSTSYFQRYLNEGQMDKQHIGIIQLHGLDDYQQWKYLWDEMALRDVGHPFFEYAVDFWSIHLRLAFEHSTVPYALVGLLCNSDDVYAKCCKALRDSWRNSCIEWDTALEFAVANDIYDLAMKLQSCPTDLDEVKKIVGRLLIDAIEKDQVSKVNSILALDRIYVNTVCKSDGLFCRTVLEVATSLTMVDVLVDHGADVNLANYSGRTPLYTASYNKRAAIVPKLLNYGADSTLRDNMGTTVLHLVAKINNLEIGKILLTHVSNKDRLLGNIRGQLGNTPLHEAVRYGHTDFIQLLVDHGSDLTLQADDGLTPLHTGIKYNQEEAVRSLLKFLKPSAIDIPDERGLTALHYAVESERLDFVNILLKSGASPQIKTREGQTTLHQAVIAGHIDIAKSLLKHGVDPLACDNKGETSLRVAIVARNTDLVRLLLENSTHSLQDTKYWEKSTVTETALRDILESSWESSLPDLDLFKLLLQYGVGLDFQDSLGTTILHMAITKRRFDTISLLLDSGVDPTVIDSQGRTAMHFAIQVGFMAAITFMKQHPLSEKHSILATKRDLHGCTILHYAARQGSIEIFHCVLDYCCKYAYMGITQLLNDTDDLGRDTLHHAILGHHSEAAQFLLSHKVISTSRRTSPRRFSALHLAVEKACPAITQALLEHGFSPNLHDSYDRTPLAHLAATGFAPEHIQALDTSSNTAFVACRSCRDLPATYGDIIHHYIYLFNLLIKYGADIYALDVQGNTPRKIALKLGNTVFATCLAELEKGSPNSAYLSARRLDWRRKSIILSQRVAGYDMTEAEEKIPVLSEDNDEGSSMSEDKQKISVPSEASDVTSIIGQ